MGIGIEGDVLLPVGEGLIAQEPLPLPIDGIAHREVGVHGAGSVVCIEARDVCFGRPIAVASAV